MTNVPYILIGIYLIGAGFVLVRSLRLLPMLKKFTGADLLVDFMAAVTVVLWPIAIPWGILRKWFTAEYLGMFLLFLFAVLVIYHATP